ncbi:suppressor of SWI4 1 homolog isoform X2 [Lampris incognitus]|uniref:suppressor of SWI4 1 homolog isoform X2 n=1 Tax=Lampris incognitus TaxID=2546036 RepID=UPI0024B5CA6D|nr:suppressor of SWI4 1 homolog isoform X2 [Lampris incognitus]
MGKTKTKNQKKSRVTANHLAEETFGAVPHSFVFHRGQIGKNVGQLLLDMRRVMEPYTAESLKMRKKNVLKDFVTIAGPLGVTHFVIFSKTPSSVNMRVVRLPKGPTLHFKVIKVKLMATVFQNMFPSINVHKVNLNNIKRCVLLNYNPESQEIEFRHYSLKVVPVGMSRGVKKLMQERFPNMNKLEDISELLMKGANLSESEAEQDGEHNITELPQIYSGRGNMASQQSAVRMTEIGPRMTLQLVKIQEGIGEGNVLYHAVVSKTEEEIQAILARKEAQLKEKEERRKKQEQNIVQKKQKQEDHKTKSLEGIKRKREEAEKDNEIEDPGMQEEQAACNESEDEVEYYRQAVGKEPDADMFPVAKKARGPGKSPGPFKKRKKSLGQDRSAKLSQGHSPRGQHREMARNQKRKEGKKRGDGEKPFGKKIGPGGKRLGGRKPGDREKNFGGKKKFAGSRTFGGKKNTERGFKSKGQTGKPGFKKGPGAKRGFKQRKGKS